MSFVAVAVGASAVVSAAGAIYAGKQQKAAADYNAKVQQQQAQLEAQEGKERVARMRKDAKKFQARALAVRAAQGIDVSAGSSLMLEAENAETLELQALEAARASDITQRKLIQGAKITRMQGKAQQKASFFQAGASLLSGAADIATIKA